MQLRRVPRAFGRVPTSPALSPGARTRLQALTVWQQTGDWRLVSQAFGCPGPHCIAGADSTVPEISAVWNPVPVALIECAVRESLSL